MACAAASGPPSPRTQPRPGAGRIRLDTDLARHLVAAQFPAWAALSVEPVSPGGWDNRTFRLGQTLLLRFPSAARYAAQVGKEQTWLPRLAPRLPLAVPEPVALGVPGEGYPWPWSVYRWIEGESAAAGEASDEPGLARDLAGFLAALRDADATNGPSPGAHSFHRGGSLPVYDAEVRQALAAADGRFDPRGARLVWERALATQWAGRPTWVHGDIAPGNLLLRDGRLSAVIDFGCLAAGDPACDLAIAWSFFRPPARAAFRAATLLDEDTWARARGWALWKAAILATGVSRGPERDVARARLVLEAVLED